MRSIQSSKFLLHDEELVGFGEASGVCREQIPREIGLQPLFNAHNNWCIPFFIFNGCSTQQTWILRDATSPLRSYKTAEYLKWNPVYLFTLTSPSLANGTWKLQVKWRMMVVTSYIVVNLITLALPHFFLEACEQQFVGSQSRQLHNLKTSKLELNHSKMLMLNQGAIMFILKFSTSLCALQLLVMEVLPVQSWKWWFIYCLIKIFYQSNLHTYFFFFFNITQIESPQ